MATACLGESRRDSVEFVSTADEGRARDPGGHRPLCVARPAPSPPDAKPRLRAWTRNDGQLAPGSEK